MNPRHLLFLLLLLLNVPSYGQAFRLDSLPTSGMLPNKGWRWKPGNVPNAASPTLNDSRWDTIPAFSAADSLPRFRQLGSGWIRIPFRVGPAIAGKPMALRVYQRAAARVYLDGQLIKTYGQIGPDGQLLRAEAVLIGDQLVLPPLAAGLHVVAAQIADLPIPPYVPKALSLDTPVFYVRISPLDGMVQRQVKAAFWEGLVNNAIAAAFLTLCIVHLFYYGYRRKRINLIFSLTMLFGALFYGWNTPFRFIDNPITQEWFWLFRSLLLVAYLTSLLITYRLLLTFRYPFFGWALRAGIVLMLLSSFLSHYTQFNHRSVLFVLGITAMFAAGMSLSIRAVRRQYADGWIILGSMSLLILTMTIQLIVNLLFPDFFKAYAELITDITELVFVLTVPLTLALLLARENDHTNRELARNLAEVNQLSAEKEQILTQQKAVLEEQVAERTHALQQSLGELRATQQQLVQREKMASLGELTAGIAHEIQNPLNFVNNFTEVSTELVQELAEERTRPAETRDEGLQDELIGDLAQNLEKIEHHGKRAASIVRGMLEHSRSSTGERTQTDLNALADEYLHLSYHGIRAKNKTFNAKLVTDFDTALLPVPVVAQDMGRVLLNLFNNAFYAIEQRTQTTGPGYVPTVTVTTKQVDGKAVITVADNGTGIPAAVLDKIFQPFFTTKPTGQGTGLGLSISYDIVTKGHGGTLQVRSAEGEGTTFLIELPANER
jgi:two-component system, NtrC family, sensor kinase